MTHENTIEILDMDVDTLLPKFKEWHKKGLEVCAEVGAILDFATSDVSLYIYAPSQEAADAVAAIYNTTADFLGRGLNGKHPQLNWYGLQQD